MENKTGVSEAQIGARLCRHSTQDATETRQSSDKNGTPSTPAEVISRSTADEKHEMGLSWRDWLQKDMMAFFLLGLLVSGHLL
jgi:hypothetical protein